MGMAHSTPQAIVQTYCALRRETIPMIRDISKRIVGSARVLLCGLTLVLLCVGVPPAYTQNALPPQVQADLLRQKIITAVKRHDLKAVVSATEQYKKLGVAIPPVFLLVEAKAEFRLDESVRAFSTLQSFLENSNRKSKEYREAIHLYPIYQRAAKSRADAHAEAAATQALDEAKTAYQTKHYVKALSELKDAATTAPAGSPQLDQARSLLADYRTAATREVDAEETAKRQQAQEAARESLRNLIGKKWLICSDLLMQARLFVQNHCASRFIHLNPFDDVERYTCSHVESDVTDHPNHPMAPYRECFSHLQSLCSRWHAVAGYPKNSWVERLPCGSSPFASDQ